MTSWILLLTVITHSGVSTQQIQMDERSCRSYESLYQKGTFNHVDNGYLINNVVYRAQCLTTVK